MTAIAKRRSPLFWLVLGAIGLPAAWFVYRYILPAVVFLTLITVDCWLAPKSIKELKRLGSPDHQADAVLAESGQGALEYPAYDVYLVRGGSADLKDPVVGATGKTNDLQLRWLAPKLLEVSYKDACISSFRSHWNGGKLRDDKWYIVEIRLKPPRDATPHDCE